jgi:hypothetical protein
LRRTASRDLSFSPVGMAIFVRSPRRCGEQRRWGIFAAARPHHRTTTPYLPNEINSRGRILDPCFRETRRGPARGPQEPRAAALHRPRGKPAQSEIRSLSAWRGIWGMIRDVLTGGHGEHLDTR